MVGFEDREGGLGIGSMWGREGRFGNLWVRIGMGWDGIGCLNQKMGVGRGLEIGAEVGFFSLGRRGGGGQETRGLEVRLMNCF